jgi:hypothetical protein
MQLHYNKLTLVLKKPIMSNPLLNLAELRRRGRIAIMAVALCASFSAVATAYADNLTVPTSSNDEVTIQADQLNAAPDYQQTESAPQLTPPVEKIDNSDQQDYMAQGEQDTLAGNPGGDADPLMPFNEKMFSFNLKLDEWILRPVATGYASIAPKPVRQSVGRFFENAGVIPRFANNLFQLRFAEASGEVARFGINTTLGLAGFFDPAQDWFGLKQHDDDFGLTLRWRSTTR